MSRYDAVVKMWQDWNVHTVDDLALRLDNFRILFAYNSGKLEKSRSARASTSRSTRARTS